MRLMRTALAFAILSTLALQATAAEYQYRRFNKVSGFGDTSRIDAVSLTVYAGKFFQWFGPKSACDKNASKDCFFQLASGTTASTNWKVGTEATFKETYPWGGVDGKVAAELGVTITDDDTYTTRTYMSPGYTAEASTYIDRDLVKTSYYGVWVKIAEPVHCPGTLLYDCAKYQWKPDQHLGNISALRQRSSEQTFRFLVYKSGSRPAYKLE